MAGEMYLHLLIEGDSSVPLGHVYKADEVPNLLRHVADYYDDNPQACERLFSHDGGAPTVPRNVAFPFSSPRVAVDNAGYWHVDGGRC